MANEDVAGGVEEPSAVPSKPPQVERRPERDLPSALLEPAAVQQHHRQVLGHLGRVDEADGQRPPGAGGRRDHGAEAIPDGAIGIGEVPMRLPHRCIQENRLCLARRRVAVQLADHRAAVGEKDIGSGDAVPKRCRSAPERLLHGRQAEERRHEAGVARAKKAQLVPGGGHLLCCPVKRRLFRCAQHDRHLPESRLALEPGIGDDAARGQTLSEGGIVRHAIPVRRKAAARYETASTALAPTLRSCATSRSRPPPRSANGCLSSSICTRSWRTG